MKKVISISGGATKFISLISALKTVCQTGYTPDVLVGVSAGALACLLYAVGKMDKGIEVGLNMTLDTFFGKKPVTKDGHIPVSAVLRGFRNFLYSDSPESAALGDLGNLRKSLDALVTDEVWSRYVHNDSAPGLFVLAINACTLQKEIVNIKWLGRETAIKWVLASCSMPIFVPPVRIGMAWYYDGGLRDHNAAHLILDRLENIESLVSIYSRGKIESVLCNYNFGQHIFKVLTDVVIECATREISKNDQELEKIKCETRGIEYYPIFVDNSHIKHEFDVSDNYLGYLKGIEAVNTQFIY